MWEPEGASLNLGTNKINRSSTQNTSNVDNSPQPLDQNIFKKPIGYILSLEGADSIVSMAHLEKSYEQGLRAIGPAHYGPGTYAFGTDSVGGIGRKGKELLGEITRLGLILDATHLCDQSFWETMKVYNGPVWGQP